MNTKCTLKIAQCSVRFMNATRQVFDLKANVHCAVYYRMRILTVLYQKYNENKEIEKFKIMRNGNEKGRLIHTVLQHNITTVYSI
jgi:hypothetical protein